MKALRADSAHPNAIPRPYPPYSKAYFSYREMFMRLISFLTTAATLSRIRQLVLNEERMLADLLEAKGELDKMREMIGKQRN